MLTPVMWVGSGENRCCGYPSAEGLLVGGPHNDGCASTLEAVGDRLACTLGARRSARSQLPTWCIR
jgi:hypothetical protein